MAYCVHCGVKLAESETKCPLCGTPVCDPSAPESEPAPKPYPVRSLEQTLLLNRRYAVTLLSLLLLVPAGLCLLIDALSGPLTWSIYPAGTLFLIWIAVAVPLSLRRHRTYLTLLITGAALGGYLYLLERLSGGSWFLPIVLPSLGLALALLCLSAWLILNKRVRLLRLLAIVFLQIALLCFAIELLCVHVGVSARIGWSPFVIMPCLFVALLLYVISRSGPLSTELKRRFHF